MPLSETLAAMLSGGDRRSMGRSDAAVKLVLQSLAVSLTQSGRGEYPFEVAARLETPAAPLSRKTARRLTSL
jgi:hypothetical protein